MELLIEKKSFKLECSQIELHNQDKSYLTQSSKVWEGWQSNKVQCLRDIRIGWKFREYETISENWFPKDICYLPSISFFGNWKHPCFLLMSEVGPLQKFKAQQGYFMAYVFLI